MGILDTFIIIYAIFFGLSIGSFLNACDYRIKKKITIRGSSMCTKCKHKLGFLDLVPVFSYIFLKGNCRYCHAPISIQYPVVELITSILFVILAGDLLSKFEQYSMYTSESFVFIFYALAIITIFSIFILISVHDLKNKTIPNKLVLAGIVTYALFLIISNLYLHFASGVNYERALATINTDPVNSLLGLVTGSGLLFLVVFATAGKGMGMGDVKLAILLGLLLGFPEILIALYIAVLSGAIVGVVLMIRKKKKMKSEIPFGPFLVLGTMITFFYSETLVNWGKILLGF